MFEQWDWRNTLAAARSGKARAANALGQRLLLWAEEELRRRKEASAEDIASEFAARLARDSFACLPDVEPRRFEAYLRETLKHVARNWRGRAQKHARAEILCCELEMREGETEIPDMDLFAGRAEDPVAHLLGKEAAAEFRKARETLNPVDRRIFALRFEEGLSEEEIGARLGMKTGTVGWHVHSIRRKLRKALKKKL